jgi:hypothetical protein
MRDLREWQLIQPHHCSNQHATSRHTHAACEPVAAAASSAGCLMWKCNSTTTQQHGICTVCMSTSAPLEGTQRRCNGLAVRTAHCKLMTSASSLQQNVLLSTHANKLRDRIAYPMFGPQTGYDSLRTNQRGPLKKTKQRHNMQLSESQQL